MGNTPEHVAARELVAKTFFDLFGQKYDRSLGAVRPLTAAEQLSELNCIEFNHPVVTGPPPAIAPRLSQWQAPGNDRGSYFADQGTAPTALGIGPDGTAWNLPGQPTGPKTETNYAMDPETKYMQSTAAPANDTWSTPGTPQPADGGGTQVYVPDGCDASAPGIQAIGS